MNIYINNLQFNNNINKVKVVPTAIVSITGTKTVNLEKNTQINGKVFKVLANSKNQVAKKNLHTDFPQVKVPNNNRKSKALETTLLPIIPNTASSSSKKKIKNFYL